MTDPLRHPRFPRAARYNPDWLKESCYGAHPLWLTEWLCDRLPLEQGQRILDLGCGRAKSSVFLALEYGVQVWATDLWTGASENFERICDAGVADRVFPIHADARQLPFAGGFFDAIVCIDSYNYFGTDDLYLNYLVQFLKPGGHFGFVSAGISSDFGADVPPHLQRFWKQDCWNIHTLDWWRQHLSRTGLVDIKRAEQIVDGWKLWADWADATDCADWYRDMLRTDAGAYLGYVGITARLASAPDLASYAWPATLMSVPSDYRRVPLLRPSDEQADER